MNGFSQDLNVHPGMNRSEAKLPEYRDVVGIESGAATDETKSNCPSIGRDCLVVPKASLMHSALFEVANCIIQASILLTYIPNLFGMVRQWQD